MGLEMNTSKNPCPVGIVFPSSGMRIHPKFQRRKIQNTYIETTAELDVLLRIDSVKLV